MAEENVIISVQIPSDVNDWLESMAAKEMTTKSALIRRFISQELHKTLPHEHASTPPGHV